ncbi:hypothetical protein, partial [Helicobacter bizzozeronii]|uniref:hypothetical protein n=1 Tax=Helicobacter bizzozeronii TaxID=56877 RepID=UPI001F25607F
MKPLAPCRALARLTIKTLRVLLRVWLRSIKAFATLGGLMPRLNATHCLFSYLLARLIIKTLRVLLRVPLRSIKRSTGR